MNHQGPATALRPRTRPVRFLVLAALALATAAWIWLALPHEREVRSLWVLLVKLVPFVLAAEAIAELEPAWLRRLPLARLAIPTAFLVYFCYVERQRAGMNCGRGMLEIKQRYGCEAVAQHLVVGLR